MTGLPYTEITSMTLNRLCTVQGRNQFDSIQLYCNFIEAGTYEPLITKHCFQRLVLNLGYSI